MFDGHVRLCNYLHILYCTVKVVRMNFSRISLLISTLRRQTVLGNNVTVRTEFNSNLDKHRLYIKAGSATIIRSYSNHYKFNLDVDHEVKTIMRGLQEKLDNPDKQLHYLDT